MNVLNIAELYAEKMGKMVSFVMCMLPQFFKKLMSSRWASGIAYSAVIAETLKAEADSPFKPADEKPGTLRNNLPCSFTFIACCLSSREPDFISSAL